MNSILESLRGRLIVSCQAAPPSPLARPDIIAAFAETAEQNGAKGVRIDTPDNIRCVKRLIKIPILGIYKIVDSRSEVYITPTLDSAQQVLAAGADILALDATPRARPGGETFEEIVLGIRSEFESPIMADVAVFAEGVRAAEFVGVDMLSTTLAGYTAQTRHLTSPDFDLLERLVNAVSVPVICEGRLREVDDVRRAFDCGAYAVVVGRAITGIDYLVQTFAATTGPDSPPV